MNTVLKVRKFGNSRGILFPKSLIKKSGVKDTVKVIFKDNLIMISPTETKKKKWSDVKRKKEKVDFITTKFDETEWTW